MGLRGKRPVPADCAAKTLTIQLFGPGMTALHKVGLAGLWMTLEALERDSKAMDRIRKSGGSWDRDTTFVSLRWIGNSDRFFKALFEESFKIDENGLAWFPGLGDPMQHRQHAVILNEALHSIHFQVPRTRGARNQRSNTSIEVDGAQEILRFLPFEWLPHQRASKMMLSGTARVVGWLFPGATTRHEQHKGTAHEEPRSRLLCLLYLPAGAIYFRVRQKRKRPKGKKKSSMRFPEFTMALLEFRDIQKYASFRKAILPYGTSELSVAGPCEAAWRLMAEDRARDLLADAGSTACRVIAFGPTPGTRQKTRVDLFTVRAGSERALAVYKLCRQFFETRFVRPQKGDPFWDVPQVPDLIARNLSEGREWWRGFADFVADKARRNHIFNYERGGLADMATHEKAFPESPEKTFVLACHEAWRRRLGQLGERARREGASFPDLTRREFERVRVAFSRCKNASSLRGAVTDFWSRAGSPLRPLQNNWADAFSLLDEKNWRRAKDLALLALASYKPATNEEKEALEATESTDANEEES